MNGVYAIFVEENNGAHYWDVIHSVYPTAEEAGGARQKLGYGVVTFLRRGETTK